MILVFESHPVQYRAPLYRETSDLLGPGNLRVVYSSDFSVRAYQDEEFGEKIAWEQDLLGGYDSVCLRCLRDPALAGFWALGSAGIKAELAAPGVTAVMLTSLRFQFDWMTLLGARRRGLPVLLRQETQDEAFSRSSVKRLIRDRLYRIAYRLIDRVLPIGALNAAHYRRLGVVTRESQFVRYSVPNPLEGVSAEEKADRRHAWRRRMGIPQNSWIVGFCGKLIDKKDPLLVLDAIERSRSGGAMPEIGAVVVGAGPLLEPMRRRVAANRLPVWFTGFVDQNQITDTYLAMDCLMLPSRRMGETWGLVVNEAMQAGCSVLVSEAVGCAAEFGDWDRVRVIPVGDIEAAVRAFAELIRFPRDWNWCEERMKPYALESSARALADNFRDYL